MNFNCFYTSGAYDNMRTPKIHSLYKLIDWLNNSKKTHLIKKPLNDSPLTSNAWLSGFMEADSSFQVRTTLSGKYPKLECKLEIQFIFYPCWQGSIPRDEFDSIKEVKSFMLQIAQFLEIPEYSFKQKKLKNFEKFTLKTQNIKSNPPAKN